VAGIAKAGALLREQAVLFADVDHDGKLKKVADYLVMLGDSLGSEHSELAGEIVNLTEKVQHIKNIINAQQSYTRRVSFKEAVDVNSFLDDLLAMHDLVIRKHKIEIVREFEPLPELCLEKSKLLQVFDNLIKNALEAMAGSAGQPQLRIVTRRDTNRALISITDTGHGISEEQLQSIFRFGYTTKPNGHGFGLHSSAIAMGEMNGTIAVSSPGVGHGATFTISLPLAAETAESADEEASASPPQSQMEATV
jgi:signal transduction histidine kinase